MTAPPTITAELRDDTVLEPSPSVLEVTMGLEAILWGASPVPLHLNPSALATWWEFEGPTSIGAAVAGVADAFGETVELVGPGARAAIAALLDAGVLLDPSTACIPTEEPPEDVPRSRTASVDPRAAAWLDRRARTRVDLAVGSVDLAVAADTEDVARAVAERFGNLLRVEGPPAPVRYLLVDAGDGPGVRHWLLSDAGLPLGRGGSVDEVLDELAVYLGEELLVQATAGFALRLGVLEARDHCVAVQWDLLASRPVLEGPLAELGYTIAPRQWVVVDQDHRVLPAEPVDDADATGRPALPLRAIVLWFGPGSLDVPHTLGEWVWSLVMMGCASADHRPVDRESFVASMHRLATTTPLVALSDAGPTALVAALGGLAAANP